MIDEKEREKIKKFVLDTLQTDKNKEKKYKEEKYKKKIYKDTKAIIDLKITKGQTKKDIEDFLFNGVIQTIELINNKELSELFHKEEGVPREYFQAGLPVFIDVLNEYTDSQYEVITLEDGTVELSEVDNI